MTDLAALRKTAEDQGWKVERTSGNHLRWIPPDTRHTPVISGLTNSDWRATRNTLARLRQRGLRVHGQDTRKEEQEMKDTPPPDAEPVAAEETFRCLDCGYDHPRVEMAVNPDGRPTRYCKAHMNQRRSRGRLAQIARDRERAQGSDPLHDAVQSMSVTDIVETMSESLGRADLHVVGQEPPEETEEGRQESESTDMGVTLDLREFVRSEVEVLLSALSDLETRVDQRLGTLEQGLEQAHVVPQPVAAPPMPTVSLGAPTASGGELAALITTFAQHTLWLMEFDERDLSLEEKRTLVAKAATRLAARLRPGGDA